MTTRLFLLGALLAPAVALAQPASDAVPPPPPPEAPQPPTVVEPDPTPTTTTTVITPAPTTEYEVIEDTYNAPIFVSGALVFGAAYGASVITAASTDDSRGNQRLYIPLAGPWLALNDRGDCEITLRSCDHETTAKVLLIADGIFQAAGVIGMIDGIFQPSTHRVVRHTAKLDTKVRVTPATIHGDPGVAVFGRF
ncbi:MAG TPA: hypothetical protein VK601_17565 [Kofleriaceae bacterium]|nr:hypothetical protein [Kofleriaceae bacterium]